MSIILDADINEAPTPRIRRRSESDPRRMNPRMQLALCTFFRPVRARCALVATQSEGTRATCTVFPLERAAFRTLSYSITDSANISCSKAFPFGVECRLSLGKCLRAAGRDYLRDAYRRLRVVIVQVVSWTMRSRNTFILGMSTRSTCEASPPAPALTINAQGSTPAPDGVMSEGVRSGRNVLPIDSRDVHPLPWYLVDANDHTRAVHPIALHDAVLRGSRLLLRGNVR